MSQPVSAARGGHSLWPCAVDVWGCAARAGKQKLQLPVPIALSPQGPSEFYSSRGVATGTSNFTLARSQRNQPPRRERDDDELSNLSNAAISELRRRSHGELAPTPGSLCGYCLEGS